MKDSSNSLSRFDRFISAVRKLGRLGGLLLGGIILPLSARSQTLSAQDASMAVSPMISKSTVVSHIDSTKEISVVLVLPLKDPNGAAEFVERVSTPTNEIYGKFLSPQEFAAAYGAKEADYASVEKWAKDNGLKISQESGSRTTLTVRGTAAQFEALFNTRLDNYRSPTGENFYSASLPGTIPNRISAQVVGVVGLTNSAQYAPVSKVYKRLGQNEPAQIKTDVGGHGVGGAYNAADLRTAYQIPTLGGTVPQTVAVFEQGGYADSDIRQYIQNNNLPNVTVKPRLVNGFAGGIDDPRIELEAVMDVDMIIGLNPAVQEVLVYEDGDDPAGVALLDALADVANDDLVQTLSIAYALDEVLAGDKQIKVEGQLFTQLAAEGITVLASAGDNGAYGISGNALNASDPGAQPLVTSVGGTTLYTEPTGAYLAEEVWNLLYAGLGATGGGVSAYWPIPKWQPADEVTPNGGSATNRNFPDVSTVGNPATGVAVYSAINGGWVQGGGTGASAAIWGGFVSALNSAHQTVGLGRLGFVNPLIYIIGNYEDGSLNDIIDGTNGNPKFGPVPGYYAGAYYDNCSGWGSISGPGFAQSLLLTPTKKGEKPGSFGGLSGIAGKTTAKLSWTASPRATGYLIYAGGGTFVSGTTSFTVTGLAPATQYLVTMVALNASGNLPVASPIYLTTTK